MPAGVWLPSIHDTYQECDQYELGSAIWMLDRLVVPKYVEITLLPISRV